MIEKLRRDGFTFKCISYLSLQTDRNDKQILPFCLQFALSYTKFEQLPIQNKLQKRE